MTIIKIYGILVVLVLLLAMEKLLSTLKLLTPSADVDGYEFAFEILLEFELIWFKILLAVSIILYSPPWSFRAVIFAFPSVYKMAEDRQRQYRVYLSGPGSFKNSAIYLPFLPNLFVPIIRFVLFPFWKFRKKEKVRWSEICIFFDDIIKIASNCKNSVCNVM